jgi:hypothetical protein
MLTVLEQDVVASTFDGLLFRSEVVAEKWIVATAADSDRAHQAAAERALTAVIEEVSQAAALETPEAPPSSQRDAILKEAHRGASTVA